MTDYGQPLRYAEAMEINRLRVENALLRATIERIDETLRVPAAEYVPAIQDVFRLIDSVKQKETP